MSIWKRTECNLVSWCTDWECCKMVKQQTAKIQILSFNHIKNILAINSHSYTTIMQMNYWRQIICYQIIFLVYVWHLIVMLKEELHNRFNLISEERVKNFKYNSENLMKIGWKIRKLWHLEVLRIFKKHFLTSRYEYANEWGDDVIASQFSIHFVHRNDKNFIFQLWEC